MDIFTVPLLVSVLFTASLFEVALFVIVPLEAPLFAVDSFATVLPAMLHTTCDRPISSHFIYSAFVYSSSVCRPGDNPIWDRFISDIFTRGYSVCNRFDRDCFICSGNGSWWSHFQPLRLPWFHLAFFCSWAFSSELYHFRSIYSRQLHFKLFPLQQINLRVFYLHCFNF